MVVMLMEQKIHVVQVAVMIVLTVIQILVMDMFALPTQILLVKLILVEDVPENGNFEEKL